MVFQKSQKSNLFRAFQVTFVPFHCRRSHCQSQKKVPCFWPSSCGYTSGLYTSLYPPVCKPRAPSSTLFSARNEFMPHSSLNHWNWTQMQDPDTELVLQLFKKFLRFHNTILFWPGDTGRASTCEEIQLGVGSEFHWSMKIQVHYMYAMMCHALVSVSTHVFYVQMRCWCVWNALLLRWTVQYVSLCMSASSMSSHWIWSYGHVSVHARPCQLTHTYQRTLSWYIWYDVPCFSISFLMLCMRTIMHSSSQQATPSSLFLTFKSMHPIILVWMVMNRTQSA